MPGAGTGVGVAVGAVVGVAVGVLRAAKLVALAAPVALVTSADTSGVEPLKLLAALTLQIVWLLGPNVIVEALVAPELDFRVTVTAAVLAESGFAMVRNSW